MKCGAPAAGNWIAKQLRTNEVVYDSMGHRRVSYRRWFQSGWQLFLAHRFLACLRLCFHCGVVRPMVERVSGWKVCETPSDSADTNESVPVSKPKANQSVNTSLGTTSETVAVAANPAPTAQELWRRYHQRGRFRRRKRVGEEISPSGFIGRGAPGHDLARTRGPG